MLIGHKGTSKNAGICTGWPSSRSVMTVRQWWLTSHSVSRRVNFAPNLRCASPCTAFALSLEVLLKPTVSLRRAQNRPYLDRNTYSGQYAKMASHKPRFFDFSGLEQIQTNVCIGR